MIDIVEKLEYMLICEDVKKETKSEYRKRSSYQRKNGQKE